MKHSCSRCGRIHDKGKCLLKPSAKKSTELDRFRSSQAWHDKRDEIRERDNNLCQMCIRNLYNTLNQYTYDNLSVHHGIPLEEDYDKRLDNYVLLTVCGYHHEMAESGQIPRSEILRIAKEQEHTPRGS